MRREIRTKQNNDNNRNDGTGRGRRAPRVAFCAWRLAVLLACGILCGCTRREQLVLETADGIVDAAGEAGYGADSQPTENLSMLGQQMSGNQLTSGQQVSGQTAGSQPILGQSAGSQPEAGQTAGNPPVSAQQTTGNLISGQTSGNQSASEQPTICVHVCGAVLNSGVYELAAGSRVYEAVEMAGGFAENADSSYVNLAQVLTDGTKLVIPTLEQTEAMTAQEGAQTEIGIVEQPAITAQPAASQSAATTQGGDRAGSGVALDDKVNINTASESELCSIPGIGATRAAAIVAYRQERGGFTSIEDIMNVSGIKEGTYDKIKDRIKVN